MCAFKTFCLEFSCHLSSTGQLRQARSCSVITYNCSHAALPRIVHIWIGTSCTSLDMYYIQKPLLCTLESAVTWSGEALDCTLQHKVLGSDTRCRVFCFVLVWFWVFFFLPDLICIPSLEISVPGGLSMCVNKALKFNLDAQSFYCRHLCGAHCFLFFFSNWMWPSQSAFDVCMFSI